MAQIINDITNDTPRGNGGITTTTQRKDLNNQSLPLSDILFLTLKKWPLILLSLIVCVGAALIYTLRTPTVYTRAAEIMIKETKKGASAGVEGFDDMGLFTSNTNVDNEITNLRSADLMAEVVSRLHLDLNYYLPGQFHDIVAYGSSLPVYINIIDYPADYPASLNLLLDAEGRVTLSHLHSGDTELDGEYTGQLGDTIATALGAIVVTPTAYRVPGSQVELVIDKLPAATAQMMCSAALKVSQNGDNSSVIRLTYADRSIERADNILATLIEVYKDSWIRDKNEIAVSTSKFINERLGVIEVELGNVDSDISNYKSEHLIPDVQAASSMYMTQSQQYTAAIDQLNDRIQLARFVRSYLTDSGSRYQLLPANSSLVGDISTQVGEYNDLVLQRNSLVSKSSESNPLVKNIDTELAAMRNAMIATVDTEITALKTQLHSLQSSQASATAKLATSPTQAKYLLSVERQQKVKESLYLFLLQKREENELSQAFTAYNTRIISKPGPAGVPPTPARTSILLGAFIIGLVLPFGLTMLREMSNTRVRGRKDIEHLSLPFLGEIPLAANDKKNRKPHEDNRVLVKEGKRDIINEAFRVLRTNVEFMHTPDDDKAEVVVVTSFNPGSGKSFVSMNLATTLALKGRRVLVIDGDMRHGSTSSYVGSPAEGLANYLAGTITDLNRLIIPLDKHNAPAILPIGPVPPNPTELLESPRFAQLLDTLRPHYDYIFIDCPPIEIVADAQIIDRLADRTIFIVRAGLLERNMLPELQRIYDAKKYRNMALILNGTALSHSRYGYSHGYRYGYGYGYGYGYNYGK